jgi:hypothetical protein
VVTKNNHWLLRQKLQALERGPHTSAINHGASLRDEFVSMTKKGQWVVVPAQLVFNNANLCIIPLGVVPQRDRRPRTICDYSYFLVSEDTVALAPAESM